MSSTTAPPLPSSHILGAFYEQPILIFIVPAFLFVLSTAHAYLRLAHIPGPFVAKFTNLPRFSWVRSNRAHEIHVELHRRYGSLVRFGPNMVSVGDPAAIGTLYGFGKPWLKSDFYRALLFQSRGKQIPGIFATQNEIVHRNLKKPVSGIYSMTNLVSFESYVDSTMRVFCDQLDARFVKNGGGNSPACDFGQWLQLFAFDVIGEITFSHRLGFLEQGEDVDGIISDIWNTFRKTSLVTQMPWLDSIWTNNPLQRYLRESSRSPGLKFAMSRIQEREDLQRGSDQNDWEVNDRDFLSRFMELQAKDKNIPKEALLAWTSSNITAGSDTTAIFLRTLFYQLLTHSHSLTRLLDELDSAAASGKLDELASWKQTQDLPYLDCCIKEAGRLHPPFGLPLERIVPPEGAEICGQWLKGGTVVGMSGWVVHRNMNIFGKDCDEWKPERWLCDKEQRKRMESSLLTFGAGHRSCLGKNISYLEIYKVVPTILSHFEIELLRPSKWKVQNRWFVQQCGLEVRLRKRQRKAEALVNEDDSQSVAR